MHCISHSNLSVRNIFDFSCVFDKVNVSFCEAVAEEHQIVDVEDQLSIEVQVVRRVADEALS